MSKIDKLYNLLNLLLIVMAESNAIPMEVAEPTPMAMAEAPMAEATPMAVAPMAEETPMAVAEAVPEAVSAFSDDVYKTDTTSYAMREKLRRQNLAKMLEAREKARAKWVAHQQATLALEAQQRAEAEQQAVARISQHSAIEARVHNMIARLNAIKAIRDEAELQARNGQITASAMSRIWTANPEYTWKHREEQAEILMDIVRHGGTTEQFTTALTAFKIYRGEFDTPLIESGVMSVAMDNNRYDILEFLYSKLLIRSDSLKTLARRRGRYEEFSYLFSSAQPMKYGDYQAF